MSDWHPMTERPHDHRTVIVAAFAADDIHEVDVFRCRCGEHGAYFPRDSGMMSINENGWTPFAWRPDDVPSPGDEAFPPMREDYLTRAS